MAALFVLAIKIYACVLLKDAMHLQRNIEDALAGEGEELTDWEIYKEVIDGQPRHRRIRGLGVGMEQYEDSASSSQNCNKRICLERDKEFEQLKENFATLTNEMNDLKQMVISLLPNNSANSECARNSPSMV
jgi:hypothetical protein